MAVLVEENGLDGSRIHEEFSSLSDEIYVLGAGQPQNEADDEQASYDRNGGKLGRGDDEEDHRRERDRGAYKVKHPNTQKRRPDGRQRDLA